MQDCGNSIAKALELPQSCTYPLIWLPVLSLYWTASTDLTVSLHFLSLPFADCGTPVRPTAFSPFWLFIAMGLCAVSVLFKEQGLTVLVCGNFVFIPPPNEVGGGYTEFIIPPPNEVGGGGGYTGFTLSVRIGIPVEKTFNDLPLIHATIKMHKNPIKFRFLLDQGLVS